MSTRSAGDVVGRFVQTAAATDAAGSWQAGYLRTWYDDPVGIDVNVLRLEPADSWVWVPVPAADPEDAAASAGRFFTRFEEALGRPLPDAERVAIFVAFGHVHEASTGDLTPTGAGSQTSGSGPGTTSPK